MNNQWKNLKNIVKVAVSVPKPINDITALPYKKFTPSLPPIEENPTELALTYPINTNNINYKGNSILAHEVTPIVTPITDIHSSHNYPSINTSINNVEAKPIPGEAVLLEKQKNKRSTSTGIKPKANKKALARNNNDNGIIFDLDEHIQDIYINERISPGAADKSAELIKQLLARKAQRIQQLKADPVFQELKKIIKELNQLQYKKIRDSGQKVRIFTDKLDGSIMITLDVLKQYSDEQSSDPNITSGNKTITNNNYQKIFNIRCMVDTGSPICLASQQMADKYSSYLGSRKTSFTATGVDSTAFKLQQYLGFKILDPYNINISYREINAWFYVCPGMNYDFILGRAILFKLGFRLVLQRDAALFYNEPIENYEGLLVQPSNNIFYDFTIVPTVQQQKRKKKRIRLTLKKPPPTKPSSELIKINQVQYTDGLYKPIYDYLASSQPKLLGILDKEILDIIRPPIHISRPLTIGKVNIQEQMELGNINMDPWEDEKAYQLFRSLISEFNDVFTATNEIGSLPGEVKITLKPDYIPYAETLRETSLKNTKLICDEIRKFIKLGIVVPLKPNEHPTFVSNVFLVHGGHKANGEKTDPRVVVDYKWLNLFTKRLLQPLPIIHKMVQNMVGFDRYCSLDIVKSFYHMRLDYASSLLTTFVCPLGLHRFTAVPNGVTNGPGELQLRMNMVVAPIKYYCQCKPESIKPWHPPLALPLKDNTNKLDTTPSNPLKFSTQQRISNTPKSKSQVLLKQRQTSLNQSINMVSRNDKISVNQVLLARDYYKLKYHNDMMYVSNSVAESIQQQTPTLVDNVNKQIQLKENTKLPVKILATKIHDNINIKNEEYIELEKQLEKPSKEFVNQLNDYHCGKEGCYQRLFNFIDDIMLGEHSEMELVKLLSKLFQLARKYGIRFKLKKCLFNKRELLFVGHIINKTGHKVNNKYTKSILSFPVPTNRKELDSYLGTTNLICSNVPNYAEIVAAFSDLRRSKEYIWQEHHQYAFEAIRDICTNIPVLYYPRLDQYGGRFWVITDSSGQAIGATLYQERAINYETWIKSQDILLRGKVPRAQLQKIFRQIPATTPAPPFEKLSDLKKHNQLSSQSILKKDTFKSLVTKSLSTPTLNNTQTISTAPIPIIPNNSSTTTPVKLSPTNNTLENKSVTPPHGPSLTKPSTEKISDKHVLALVPIAFHSRILSPTEQAWHISEKELQAIVDGCNKFNSILLSRLFIIVTDHINLCNILNYCKETSTSVTSINQRLVRQAAQLSPFNFICLYGPGTSQLLTAPDYLSRSIRAQYSTNPLERSYQKHLYNQEIIEELTKRIPVTATNNGSTKPIRTYSEYLFHTDKEKYKEYTQMIQQFGQNGKLLPTPTNKSEQTKLAINSINIQINNSSINIPVIQTPIQIRPICVINSLNIRNGMKYNPRALYEQELNKNKPRKLEKYFKYMIQFDKLKSELFASLLINNDLPNQKQIIHSLIKLHINFIKQLEILQKEYEVLISQRPQRIEEIEQSKTKNIRNDRKIYVPQIQLKYIQDRLVILRKHLKLLHNTDRIPSLFSNTFKSRLINICQVRIHPTRMQDNYKADPTYRPSTKDSTPTDINQELNNIELLPPLESLPEPEHKEKKIYKYANHWTTTDIREQQRRDLKLNSIIRYLVTHNEVHLEPLSPFVRKLAKGGAFGLDKQLILYIGLKKLHELKHKQPDEINGEYNYDALAPKGTRVVLSSSMAANVILLLHKELCHDSRLEYIILEKFWCPNIHGMIIDLINACDKCQITKKRVQKDSYYYYNNIDNIEKFNQVVSMDTVGPLPIDDYGNRYYSTILDHFSNYLVIVPHSRATDEQIALSLLENWVYVYGVMDTFVCDNGSGYHGPMNKLLRLVYGIKVRTITPGNSKCMGRNESKHSYINNAITIETKYLSRWSLLLKPIQYSYNINGNKFTGVPPHSLVYGKTPKISIDQCIERLNKTLAENTPIKSKESKSLVNISSSTINPSTILVNTPTTPSAINKPPIHINETQIKLYKPKKKDMHVPNKLEEIQAIQAQNKGYKIHHSKIKFKDIINYGKILMEQLEVMKHKSLIHRKKYIQQKITQFNKNVTLRSLAKGTEVMRYIGKLSSAGIKYKQKWEPGWIIIRVNDNNTYKIQNSKGHKRNIHRDFVREYRGSGYEAPELITHYYQTKGITR